MSLYSTLYHSAIWPGYEKLRGRHTHALLSRAESRQWWPADRLRDWQSQELMALLAHARKNCAWYRNLSDDLTQVPYLTKEIIRDHRDELRARDCFDGVYEHRTGGSTGIPLKFFVNRNSYEWRLAVSMRGYAWAGCREAERQFYVWGQPIGTPPLKQRIKTCLHNASVRRQLFSSFNFRETAMAECVERITRFRPKTIIGYTNALCLLAQHIIENRKKIPSPTGVITAAEGVNAQQRAIIEQAFGAPVFASYGSREFMLIAMECDQHRGLHLSSDNLLVEVVVGDRPARVGEIGEILVTDLHNFGMPFIRYKIGDLGVLADRQCPCGRGLPLLERVEGRVLDVIRTPDGHIVPGEFFPHLMKEFDAVKQFQVVQKSLNHLLIKLVLRPGDHATQLARLKTEVEQMLGNQIRLELQELEEIPQTSSGKFRVTISELPASAGPANTAG